MRLLAPGFRGGLRIRRVVGESQAQAGQFAAGIAAQTEAGQLYGAQEAGFGEKGLRSKVPHRLLLSGCKSWSQPAQEIGACLGKLWRMRSSANSAYTERDTRAPLACRRAGPGWGSPASRRCDLSSSGLGLRRSRSLRAEAAHVLVEPMQGLVPIVRAPSGEGQTPQSSPPHRPWDSGQADLGRRCSAPSSSPPSASTSAARKRASSAKRCSGNSDSMRA